MKIVIDIPEEDYKRMIEQSMFGRADVWRKAIQNGTPLPKGHGRLIDADAFIAKMEDASKRQKYKQLLIDDCLTVDDVFKAIIESLQNKGLANGDTPTIIETDTESEDKRTEERTKTHACDCISRQAVSDIIKTRLYQTALNNTECITSYDKVCEDIAENRIDTWINEAKSVEPEQNLQPTCNQLATDCISRQAALDLAESGKLVSNGNYKSVCDAINGLPSVEPGKEDRECASCKYSNNGECAYTEECHECMWESKYEKQVEPERKPGKWIEKEGYDGDVYYDCSVCGNSWTTIDGTPWDNGMNYCPKCGARMEVQNDN